MKFSDINIRDPFVLMYDSRYYMYGTRGSEAWTDKSTGLDVYVSEDLENWSDPIEVFTPPENFWAQKISGHLRFIFIREAFICL